MGFGTGGAGGRAGLGSAEFAERSRIRAAKNPRAAAGVHGAPGAAGPGGAVQHARRAARLQDGRRYGRSPACARRRHRQQLLRHRGLAARRGRAQRAARAADRPPRRRPGRWLATTPRAGGNRAEYTDGAVSEWYANGPYGLEQGFTVARGWPGAITISLARDGSGRAAARRQHRRARKRAPLRSALSASTPPGRRLPSRLSVSRRPDRARGRRRARPASRSAIDPFVYEETLQYIGTPALGEEPGGVADLARTATRPWWAPLSPRPVPLCVPARHERPLDAAADDLPRRR